MVFGWGKKKSEKQETIRTQEEKTIKLDTISKITEEILSIKTKTAVAEVKAFQKKINDKQDELLKIAKELENDDLKLEEFDKHLQILVVRGKKAVINTIKNECSPLSEPKTISDVLSFYESLSQTIKKIGDVLGNNSRVIHIFAKKYAQKLKDNLEVLTDDHNQIKNIVESYKKTQSEIDEISNINREINELEKTLHEKENRIEELNQVIKDSEKDIKRCEANIEKLKSSKQYSEFQKSKKLLDQLEDKKGQINNEIIQQFVKISRELNRYEYVSALEKPQKYLLRKLIDQPFDALTDANKEEIKQILHSVKKGVENDSISVKDKEKSLSNMDETIAALDGFILKINDFLNKKKEQVKTLDSFDMDELEKNENTLAKTKSDKIDAESKIQLHKNEISEIKETIPKKVVDIEIKLHAISDTKYKIQN